MRHPFKAFFCAVLLASTALPAAADVVAKMAKATQDGTSEALGTVTISDGDKGALITVALHGLPPGQHGFHIHENANCGPTLLNGVRIPAGAAGSHFDPDNTGKHMGPTGEGHLGDLPLLEVGGNGTVNVTLDAPRIRDADSLKGHSIIIHVNGDNYSDQPALLGGGGGRYACGIIE